MLEFILLKQLITFTSIIYYKKLKKKIFYDIVQL